MSVPGVLAQEVLAALGDEVVPLTGGVVNAVWLARHADRVLKTNEAAPPTLFEIEAEGLAVLRRHGLTTPRVHDVGPDWMLLEALTPQPPASDAFWESAGRAIAALHDVRGPRFGWDHDGWLGLLPQHNAWHDDGHVFFAEQRLLRYLDEPKADAVLTADDRDALERLCARLPEIVPAAPPALTHGDLWHNNVVATAAGEPAFIDPAVSWTWPEVDVSMMFCSDHSPAGFFAAYHEVRPPEPGWQDRMHVLNLREVLSTLAHEGDRWGALGYFRDVVRPFHRVPRSGG
ncbi:fructosamine kinase family protein [Saccharothrix sp. NRRL B-16314]|uniref:fructosamine kinase family protein n=1 Tax=Saccharothrix sp. NRRL B-16314 TaxID=1463825 RepID=UPI0005273B16|nr:fructosamine kinase family protein [Saccharothrix sp. NRRL B-16314]